MMSYSPSNGVTSDGEGPTYIQDSVYVEHAKSVSGAVKNDLGKASYYILPLDLLDGATRVFSFGAKKYAEGNFRLAGGLDPRRTLSAAMRHISEACLALITEDKERMKDPESGEAHLHHAICSLIMAVDGFRQRGWKV